MCVYYSMSLYGVKEAQMYSLSKVSASRALQALKTTGVVPWYSSITLPMFSSTPLSVRRPSRDTRVPVGDMPTSATVR